MDASAPSITDAVRAEASRIEEDALYSSRGHFGAAKRWSRVHFWLGLPAAVIAAVSGVAAVASNSVLAASLAAIVTALTATLTFLNPNDKAHTHHAAGTRFNALRNAARRFRDIDLALAQTAAAASAGLAALAKARDDLNESSPQIPRWAFLDARRSIEAGEAKHAVDEGPLALKR